MRSFTGLWGGVITGLVLSLWGSVAIAQSPRAPNRQPATSAASRPSSPVSAPATAVETRAIRAAPPSANAITIVTQPPAPSPSVAAVAVSPVSSPGFLTAKQQSSRITERPLICDDSGKICVPAETRAAGVTAPGAATAAVVRRTSGPPYGAAAGSASPLSNPGIQQTNHPLLPITRQPLICDSSGKICVESGTVRAPTSPGKGAVASTPPISGTAMAAAVIALPPATQASPAASLGQGAAEVPKASAKELELLDRSAEIHVDGATIYGDTATLLTDDPFDWAVYVYKSRHLLQVYFKEHLYKSYHAVFGRSLSPGAKIWEGDRRTPEGDYLIIGKHRSARFGWFLHINYPNSIDQERFEQSRAARLIPASAGEGGQIGIHGTDAPYLNVGDVNWTTGCISVDNADIKELARLLPIGTLVVINP